MKTKQVYNSYQGSLLVAVLFCLFLVLNSPVIYSASETGQPQLSQTVSQDIVYACPMHAHETSDHKGKCSICGMFLVAQEVNGQEVDGLNSKNLQDLDIGDDAQDLEDDESHELVYACPMHLHETSDHPGKCPVCGMFLVALSDEDEHSHTDSGDMQHDMATIKDKDEKILFWENRKPGQISDQLNQGKTGTQNLPVTQRLLVTQQNGKSDNSEHVEILQSSVEHEEKNIHKPEGKTTYICPMHPQIIQHEPGGSCPICGMDLVAKENKMSAGGVKEGSGPQVFLEAAVIQNMGVRTAKVRRKVLEKQIQTQGRVTPDDERMLSIHPRTGGWIEVLQLVTEGDRVERKDILYDFYSPWINEVQLDFIEALEEFDRTSFDPSKKTEVGAKVSSLRNSLRLLNASDMDIMRIENNRKVQNTIQMMAPQGGVITRLSITEGSYVEPYQSMFTIVDLSQVWVMVDIYENHAPWVRKGNEVKITAPAIPARTWEGVVDFIYPEVDPKTRTLRARITIQNPDEALLLNMFVKVNITANTSKQAVLTVPREAVIITGERVTVIKSLGKGHFQPVDVKTGMRGEGSIEILSGLEQGDNIVVSGQFLIDSESSLQASFLRMSE